MDWLAWAEYWFNTSYNASSKTTPFQVLYGCPPPVLFRGETYPSNVEEVASLIAARDNILRELKDNLHNAQQQMKKYADKHHREVVLEIGDWVYLKSQPYRMRSLAKRPNEKLSPRFYGPFQILARVGPVAYRIQLPDSCKLHSVFHISKLKKALPPKAEPLMLPPALAEDGGLLVQPAGILGTRESADGFLEVLIHWKNLPSFDDSWESAEKIATLFPDFHLEDKVTFGGGSSVSKQRFGLTYNRKRGNQQQN